MEKQIRTITFMVTTERDASVWRKIEFTENHTLHDVHGAIQDAFLLGRDHLYAFFANNNPWDEIHKYGGPEVTAPHDALLTNLGSLSLPVNKRMLYIFDFGDELWHELKVMGHAEVEEGVHYPRVVDAQGTPPPQYPVCDDAKEEDDKHDEDGPQGSDDRRAEIEQTPKEALVALVPDIKKYVQAHYRRRDQEDDDTSQKRTLNDLVRERDIAFALITQSGASAEIIHTNVEHAIDGTVWGWLNDLPQALSRAGRSQDAVDLALTICEAWKSDRLTFELPLFLARADRRDEATARVEENLTDFPETAHMLLMAGMAFQHMENHRRAEECYRQALAWAGSRFATRKEIVNGLSRILEATGRDEEARDLHRSEQSLRDRLQLDRMRAMGIVGPPPVRRETPKIGRNAPCPCGSGKKYKKCCGKGQ